MSSGRPRVTKVKVENPQDGSVKLKFHTTEINSTYAASLNIISFDFGGISITPDSNSPTGSPSNSFNFAYEVPEEQTEGLQTGNTYTLTINYVDGDPGVCYDVEIGSFKPNKPATGANCN